MSTTDSHPVTRETLLTAIRTAAQATGRDTISLKKFLATSGIQWRRVYSHFPSWNEALAAATGIQQTAPGHTKIDPTHLMEDCARVARMLGRMPSRREYSAHGNFHECTLAKSCGRWGKVAPALRSFATKRREWSDLLEFLPSENVKPLFPRRRHSQAPCITPRNSIACGAPLDFGALRHEPTNEQGVVFLFGMLAEKLGFLVEGFQAVFPDCQAKRLGGPPLLSRERWRDVKIEFEYESRNFRGHQHNPAGCDLIVCWNHNWQECPVEVLALKDEAKKLKARM